MGVSAPFDVFLSHTWRGTDLEGARRLRDALTGLGLSVWFDETNARRHEGLSAAVAVGLAESKVLVAWYSREYVESRPCQWELSAALLAGQQLDAPQRRILVVNPEEGTDHVHPVELRDPLYSHLDATSSQSDVDAAAGAIAARVAEVAGVFGDARPTGSGRWVGSVRPSPARFVGRRTELFRLHTALTGQQFPMTSEASGPAVAQLLGLGGSGKTLLAARYAEQFGAAYPGKVFWHSATRDPEAGGGEEAAVRSALLKVAPAGLPVAELETLSIEQLREAVGAALDGPGEPFLWVVDDLDRDATLAELQLWSAPGAMGSTLVTSLRGAAWSRGTREQHILLDQLDEDAALRLLTWDQPPAGEREQHAAQELVAELGRHALAIDVTRAALHARGSAQTYRDYLAGLENPSEDELERAADLVGPGELPTEHSASIALTILRSTDGISEHARDVLLLACELAPEPIPQAVITETIAQADELDASDARDRAAKALRELGSRALATREGADGAPAHWDVHALVRRAITRTAPDRDRRGHLRHAARAAIAAHLARRHAATGAATTDNAATHARHLLATPEPTDSTLRSRVANDDYLLGRFHAARELQEQVLEARTRLLGNEHPATLTIKNNLAGTLRALGELTAARELQEQVLEAMVRLLGLEHPATLTIKNNLAETLRALGELTAARELQEQVLEAMVRLLGLEHPDTLTIKNNLAGTLWALGERAGARELQEQVLEARTRLLGLEHPDTLTIKNNLAETLRALGELTAARELQEQVLEAMVPLLGLEHPDTLTIKNNLAGTLWALGERAGARELQEQVLEARTRLLGLEHPDTLIIKNNLAETLRALGELTAARELQEQVLEAMVRLLGAEHPDTLTIKNNLAGTLWALGERAGARELQEQVLEAMVRLLGLEHPDTLIIKNNLAETLRALGELTAARELQEQVLEARTRLLGAEHPDTLTIKKKLAVTLWALGELTAAREL